MYTLYDKTEEEIRSSTQDCTASRENGKYARKAQNPASLPLSGFAPGTAPQMAVTAAEGAAIIVVPVSMTAKFSLPILTVLPFTVTPEQHGAAMR
jgi:hypothetical protein